MATITHQGRILVKHLYFHSYKRITKKRKKEKLHFSNYKRFLLKKII